MYLKYYEAPNDFYYTSHFDFQNKLNLFFSFGTGDTFNALTHLWKYPPNIPMDWIVKKSQLNLILELIKLFEKQPETLHIIDYFNHDFAKAVLGPNVNIQRFFPLNHSFVGCVDVWVMPNQYSKIATLSHADLDFIRSVFLKVNSDCIIDSNSIILYTSRGSHLNNVHPNWVELVSRLSKSSERKIYQNLSVSNFYNEPLLPGAVPLKISHSDMLHIYYSKRFTVTSIGVRSGAFDIIKYSGQKALIYYYSHADVEIFKSCRMSSVDSNLDSVEYVIDSGMDGKLLNNNFDFFIDSFI